jgi:hypothetical protein
MTGIFIASETRRSGQERWVPNAKCLLDKVTAEPVGTDTSERVIQIPDFSIVCHDR